MSQLCQAGTKLRKTKFFTQGEWSPFQSAPLLLKKVPRRQPLVPPEPLTEEWHFAYFWSCLPFICFSLLFATELLVSTTKSKKMVPAEG